MKKSLSILLVFAGVILLTAQGTHMAVDNLNGIRFADQFPGTDCGARVNAALISLEGPGEVWINQACGALGFGTAVTVSANSQGLRFVTSTNNTTGAYFFTAPINLAGTGDWIIGQPNAMGVANINPIMLQMWNNANLPYMIRVTGQYAVLRDITVDGNYSHNANAGPNILVTSGGTRIDISNVVSGDSNSHGVELDNVASPKVFKLMTYRNQKDGFYCNTGADGFISNSEFEDNQQNGIELDNCPAYRILHDDLGGNSQSKDAVSCGINIYGTHSGGQANWEMVSFSQFGNEYQSDLCINGYNSGNDSVGNTITDNAFIGSTVLIASNTFSEIKLVDGGQNTITGNTFAQNSGSACAISISETANGRAMGNNLSGNAFDQRGPWGTSGVCDTTQNKDSGITAPAQGTSAGMVLVESYSPPVISSGFGSNAKIVRANGTTSFELYVGTGDSATSGVLGMPTASTGWSCQFTDMNTNIVTRETRFTPTTVTVTAASAWTAGDKLLANCAAF